MPKLPVITSKRLIQIIKVLGFQLDHTTGSHFVFYHSITKRRAVVPRHNKDLPKGTIKNIIGEAGITKEEIVQAIKKK
ncbi:MAG: type II toxin-antitoxin system HicA family toxin [Minisyncoccales bacterium]